ncbi:MAG: ATP-binding protein [Clostridia bacterium]|nr:ATP-binding protein [Clostridia bacterium]
MAEYLKRKMDAYLEEWKSDSDRKPLIIKGARQVGKTKSIDHFAEKHYESIVKINFAETPIYTQIVENGYSPEAIIKNISRINPAFKFIKGKTLFFFDEIQEFPDIVTSLKFFALDGNYDVICSGSLLGVHYKDISNISVGYKTEIEMRSLDFEEFLWAVGYDDSVKNDILDHMLSFTPFSPAVLEIYNSLFLDYNIVGGMPEAVKDFVERKTFENTLEIQRQIIIGYEADIKKYAVGLDKPRIANVFRSIPFQLGKENKKFQLSKVRTGAKFQEYRGCLEWLEDAGIVNISRALQTPNLPLKGNVIEDCCVLYYADSGLLLSQLDDEAQADFRQNKNLNVYKGGLFESIVGEALVKSGYALHYFKKENSTLQEEFFVRYKDYLVPIEVKAGNNKSKSLATLIKSDNYGEIAFGIKIVKGNIGYESNICTFPHFCAFLIKDFLASFNFTQE